MNQKKIDAAVNAAKEFIIRAKAYKDASKRTYVSNGHEYRLTSPRESGALRRQSMELTRALADLRRPE